MIKYTHVSILGDSHHGTLHGCPVQDVSTIVTCYNLSPMSMYEASLLSKDFFSFANQSGLWIFCFGEIDVRCLIHNQIHEKNRKEEEVINSLVDSFIDKVFSIHQESAIMSVVPPIRFYGGDYDSKIEHKSFPFKGSDEDRARYTRAMNQRLQEKCKEKNFTFINVYEEYKDQDGFLMREYSDGAVHILNKGKAYSLVKKLNLF